MKKNSDFKKILGLLMKVSLIQVFIAIVFTGISLAFDARSQALSNRTVSLKMDNYSVTSILSSIEKQAKVKFTYRTDLFRDHQLVSIHSQNDKLSHILDRLLTPLEIKYRIIGRQIVLTESNPTANESIMGKDETAGHPVPLRITGKVTDEKGEGLPGVSVQLKGTQQGTTTNANGDFVVDVADDQTIIVFSFVGYISQQVVVGKRTSIEITLAVDEKSLEEVVVVGYGTQKKITMTGAVSTVGSADLVKSPNASIANTLAGRVTGLSSVQYSGMPGADDPRIYVRGIGSLTESGSSPLILVDGIERSFTQLDPNEVESISVLKDASATAVFGIRGANGVVIVTTKRGSEGKPQISFSTSTGLQVPVQLHKLADSYTYATVFNAAQLSDNPSAVVKFSPEAIEAFRTKSDPLVYPDINWLDYIMKPSALQSQHNVNVSGGSSRVKYFVSLGRLNQDGLFRNFDSDYNSNFKYTRYNYRANIDVDATKTTKISLTIGGRSEERNQPWFSNAPGWTLDNLFRDIHWAVPYSGAGVVDGKYITTGTRYISGTKRDGLNLFYGRGFSTSLKNVLNLDINVTQNLDPIVKGLSFRARFSNNSIYMHTKGRSSSKPSYEAIFLRDIDPSLPEDKTIIFRKNGEEGLLGYGESFNRNRDWYMDAAFSYARDFGAHHVTALALYNASKSFYPGTNTDIPLSYVGLAGRVTYDYKYRYLLDINLGYNGSENFAPKSRFGLFPAVSIGWIASDEDFLKGNTFIKYLKFRGSLGVVGNDRQAGARFLYLADSYLANSSMGYASSTGYSFGTNNPTNHLVASESKLGNPKVTWEKATKQNYGVELKIINENFGINFDYFREHRKNILTTRQTVPGFIAANLPALNIGEVENKGFELELKWRHRIGIVSYFVNGNMSFSRNKVLYKDEVPRSFDYMRETGQRVNQPFGYVFDGFWSAHDVENLSSFPNHLITPQPGDMRYRDLNNDGVIDLYDQRPIGYPDYPEYVFGSSMGLEIKGFDVSLLWSGATHVSRRFDDIYRRAFGPEQSNALLQYMVDGQWTPETAATATYPRISISAGQGNNNKTSDFWVKDASYIRLKNVEIGYNFTGYDRLKKLGINRLRVYINGYNLLTFDKIKIVDPESLPAGNAMYPVMKIYNAGLNVTF